MFSYCLEYRKNVESKNPKVARTQNRRTMLLSKCEVYDSNKSKFIKELEASGLLTSLGIKTPLSEIPLLGPRLFYEYKMNEMVNKFLLAGGKYMPEMHLRQPEFRYSSCGPFTKKEIQNKIQNFKETED